MDNLAARATEDYDRLLRDERAVAQEFEERLFDRMRQAKLTFGGRILCPFLRPAFLSPERYEGVRAASRTVMEAVRTVESRLGEELWTRVDLTPAERELCAIDPGYRSSAPTGRLDAFYTPDGFRFVELNAESPAGIAYNEALAELFLELPLMEKLQQRWEVRVPAARERLLSTLLDCYREAGGRQEHPTIAVVDYDEVPTRSEHHLFRDFFATRGYPAVVCDPRDLTYERGALHYEGRSVDVVYKRLLVNEFIEKAHQLQPLLQAARDRAVTLVNPFRCKPVHKKAIFAVLTDEAMSGLFTEEQRAVLAAHVPWTRRLVEGRTTRAGKTIDLPRFVARHRTELVLKPNDEYGGKGVFIGAEMSDTEWRSALAEALRSSYVVQDRVEVERQSFPEPAPAPEQGVRFRDFIVDLDPFLFQDQVEGVLTRLSASAVANVSSGGGAVPAFVVTPR